MSANLPIIRIPNMILRQRAAKVTQFDDELKKLVDQMLEVMRTRDGIGLAAPQVGISKRIVVIEYEPEEGEDRGPAIPRTILINPTITKHSKEQEIDEEGCLSLPDLHLKVKRAKEVNVAGFDQFGNRLKVRAKGLFARVLQHEIDHLDGILFTDKAEEKERKNLTHYGALHAVFMGTPEFAVPALEAMAVHGLPILGVITEPDKPVGRKQEITPPPVKIIAEEFGIPIFQPEDKEELADIVKQLSPHYLVVAAYGRILPKEILDIPPYGVLNIHASLLPKYRGASPIQSAILTGETETGVTIMKIDEGVDTGAIVTQETEVINPDDTADTLSERLAIKGANLLIKTLPGYLSNQIQPQEQDETQATYTKLIKKEDGLIDWGKESVEEIERKIRAYTPWPHAYAMLTGSLQPTTGNTKRLIIHQAHVENGKLVPDVVQLEGKGKTSWRDFKAGFRGKLPTNLK